MKFNQLKQLIKHCEPAKLIEQLAPFLTDRRKLLIEDLLSNRLFDLHIAIENPTDAHNAAAVIRSAEGLGIHHIHVIGDIEQTLYSRRVTQGSVQWVDVHHYTDLDGFLQHIKSENLLLAGAALTQHTKPLNEVPVDKPLCLMFGNEHTGLSDEAIAACDVVYKIPMYGMVESYNLSVSAAISMYDVSQRMRSTMINNISDERLENIRACFYADNVDERLLKQCI